MPIYRIKDWDATFENAASRKLTRLAWVAIPNKTDGEGYTALVDHSNAAAHLGAWYAIVEAASKQKPRGLLPGGIPQDISGVCRSLGRMSRLPPSVFEEVIPRLVEIGWLECLDENKQVVVSLAESADLLAESARRVAESAGILAESPEHIEGNGIEGNGRGHTKPCSPNSFQSFISPWPRVANPDHAARAWISCIDTQDDEAAAMASRDRYLASDEVSRGVVMDPAKWLMDQKSAKWCGKWPGPRAVPLRKLTVYELAVAAEKEKRNA